MTDYRFALTVPCDRVHFRDDVMTEVSLLQRSAFGEYSIENLHNQIIPRRESCY